MKITLNEQVVTLSGPITLLTLLKVYGYTEKKMAVAINHILVNRDLFAVTKLHDKDIVDVIVPMQGG